MQAGVLELYEWGNSRLIAGTERQFMKEFLKEQLHFALGFK